jgi:hypothetical protein
MFKIRDALDTRYCFCRISGRPDIQLIQKPDTGYPARYPVKAGYRISGQIFVLTNIFLIKYKIIFVKL